MGAPTAQHSPARRPRWGDRLEVEIERLDHKGRGLGHVAGDRVLTRAAVPGSRALVEVVRRRGERIEARLVEVLDPGPWTRPARCEHFGTCGGCAFQTYDYAAQLGELQRQISEQLREAGALGDIQVEPVLGATNPWNYRNKMDFTFANRRWVEPSEPQGVDASFALGLHVPGRFDKVLDLAGCAIHFEGADALLATARELAREMRLEPWDTRAHVGLLRHLVLRKGMRTGEIMVNLVTSRAAPEEIEPYAEAFLARHPEITTFVQNVNTRAASVAVGEWEYVLHGPGVIHEELGGLRFTISAGTFFQTNTLQAERLVQIVREEAQAAQAQRGAATVIFDLYCGSGTLGMAVAGGVQELWGFESVPQAVRDARHNALQNQLLNTHFVEGDVLAILEDPERKLPRPDLCLVDPPRAGLHPRVLPALVRLAPRRIVYVSCNVKAAARDLPYLAIGGYALRRVRPIDLFPHTPHVECVFTLEREE